MLDKTAAALVLLLLLPHSLAVPVEVGYEAEGRGCGHFGPECLFSLDGGEVGPGDESLDGSQRLESVEVVVKDEETPAGALVPEDGLVVDSEAVRVDHPAFVILTATWREADWRSPDPGSANLTFDEQGHHVDYFGPSARDVEGGLKPRRYSILYHDRGIGYDHFGPYNDFGTYTTAEVLHESMRACEFDPTATCAGPYDIAAAAAAEAGPDLTVGISFGRLAVEADESPSGAVRRASAGASFRASSSPPLPPLRPAPSPPSPAGEAAPVAGLGSTPAAVARWDPPAPSGSSVASERAGGNARTAIWTVAAGTALLVLLGLFALYARLRKKADILKSEMRQRLLASVAADPGVTLAELTRATGVRRSTVEHHLLVLSRAGLLRTVRTRRQVRVYPAGVRPSDLDLYARHPGSAALLRALRENPQGLSRAELKARLADLPPRTRNHLLRRLLDARVLEPAPGAGEERYVLGPALGRAAGD